MEILKPLAIGDIRFAAGEIFAVASIDQTDFDAGAFADTLFHEASHAIFEFHSVAKDAKDRKPDALALRIADLFVRLKDTNPVPQPSSKFDSKHPPSLKATDAQTSRAAGLVMVMDTLWAGEGGHPWSVDEFFASAYGGYRSNPDLLKKIVAHYAKADPKITALANELFTLLDSVADPTNAGKVPAPAKPETAVTELAKVSPMLDETADQAAFGWLIDPTRMPGPDTILCPTSRPPKHSGSEELLKPMNP